MITCFAGMQSHGLDGLFLLRSAWELGALHAAPEPSEGSLRTQVTSTEKLPSMDALLGRHVDLASIRKIGEGTFGEAFAGGAHLSWGPRQ